MDTAVDTRTSLRARFWRAAIRQAFRRQGLSVEEERERSRATGRVHPPFPRSVRVERFRLGELPCASIEPVGAGGDGLDGDSGAGRGGRGRGAGRVVLYLHGGGYVTGFIDSSLMLCVPMAKELGMRLVVPEYRLAPEHPFPAAIEDAAAAYRWLLGEGFEPRGIALAGDSAGGGLCLATIQALRDAGDPLPSAVLCLSPWADLTLSGRSHGGNAASDPLLYLETLRFWAGQYASGADPSHPLISPAFADYSGFPPILIQVDSGELLLDDSIAVAERARAAGVDARLVTRNGLWHVWPALGDLIPESREAFAEMRRFLEARM